MLNINQSFRSICKCSTFNVLHCFIPTSLLVNVNRILFKINIYMKNQIIISIIEWNIINLKSNYLTIILFFKREIGTIYVQFGIKYTGFRKIHQQRFILTWPTYVLLLQNRTSEYWCCYLGSGWSQYMHVLSMKVRTQLSYENCCPQSGDQMARGISLPLTLLLLVLGFSSSLAPPPS